MSLRRAAAPRSLPSVATWCVRRRVRKLGAERRSAARPTATAVTPTPITCPGSRRRASAAATAPCGRRVQPGPGQLRRPRQQLRRRRRRHRRQPAGRVRHEPRHRAAPRPTSPRPSASARRTLGVVGHVHARATARTRRPTPTSTASSPSSATCIKPRQGSSLGVLSLGLGARVRPVRGTTGPFKGGCSMTSGAGTAPPGYPEGRERLHRRRPTCNDVVDHQLDDQGARTTRRASRSTSTSSRASGPSSSARRSTTRSSRGSRRRAFTRQGRRLQHLVRHEQQPGQRQQRLLRRAARRAGPELPDIPSADKCCAGGDSELKGTGFYNPRDSCFAARPTRAAARTGWLTTQGARAARRDHHPPVHDLGHRRSGLRLERPHRQLARGRRRTRPSARPPAELTDAGPSRRFLETAARRPARSSSGPRLSTWTP